MYILRHVGTALVTLDLMNAHLIFFSSDCFFTDPRGTKLNYRLHDIFSSKLLALNNSQMVNIEMIKQICFDYS